MSSSLLLAVAASCLLLAPSALPSTPSAADLQRKRVSEEATAGPAVHTIALEKQYVPVTKEGKTVAYKTAYFGKIHVGSTPQAFTVVFDSGSGHLILPSTACESETCMKHTRYNRTASESAVDIEYDGSLLRPEAGTRDQIAVEFGTGEVMGEFVEESVCLGEASAPGAAGSCTRMRVVVATHMTPDPFGLFSFDGVFGLGLPALTLSPQFSFLGQLTQQNPATPPLFSVFLARVEGGASSISFGGYDPRRAASEISWAPVAMEDLGYWQVRLSSVAIGGKELEDCADGSCRAILDTGTSLLGVPRHLTRQMHRMLAREVPKEQRERPDVDCRQVPGAEVAFRVGASEVTLAAEEYSRPAPFRMQTPGSEQASLFCRSLLLPVDMPAPLGPKVFIWGEPVLRRYLTLYDLQHRRVGFALARHDDEEVSSDALPSVGAEGARLSGAPLVAPV